MSATISAGVGLWLDRPPEDALHTAALADELDYPNLWIGEMATYDAFALATAIALGTRRIPLTLGPLAVTVRDPVMIAMGVASVANLTRRRVDVALGTSSRTVVEEWHGRSRAGSSAALAETATALRPLLDGDRAEIAGTAVRTAGYRLRLDPPKSAIAVAAFGEMAIEAAATRADRMVVNLVSAEAAGQLRERLAEAAGRAGRPVPPLTAWLPAAVDPTEESLLQVNRGLVPYLAAPGYSRMFTEAGYGEVVELARGEPRPQEVLAALPLDVVETVGLVGPAEVVERRIAAYLDAGVDEIAIVPATAGDPGGRRTLQAVKEMPCARG
ncbi:MAG: LLM class F420-dependent oxidoreductase [Streptosporangiales bacterium]|nr:LLM class F420-dependent oxidoreductase [Streptosporangiales bacterium]